MHTQHLRFPLGDILRILIFKTDYSSWNAACFSGRGCRCPEECWLECAKHPILKMLCVVVAEDVLLYFLQVDILLRLEWVATCACLTTGWGGRVSSSRVSPRGLVLPASKDFVESPCCFLSLPLFPPWPWGCWDVLCSLSTPVWSLCSQGTSLVSCFFLQECVTAWLWPVSICWYGGCWCFSRPLVSLPGSGCRLTYDVSVLVIQLGCLCNVP